MYKVEFSETALKSLKKLDKQTIRIIKNLVVKNLVDCYDPTIHGKALSGNLKGFWRYRVGDYRLIARIEHKLVTIFIFEVGNRKDTY